MTAQSCSNGHLASVSTKATTRQQDEAQARPSHGTETRSKTSRVESDAASAATGRDFLTRCPEILGSLRDKAGRAGRVGVMRDVIYDMIRTLRDDVVWERQELHLQSALLQVPKGVSTFQALSQELEMSSVGEQLYRLRRRVALTKFYNDYTNAQADPYGFLYPDQNEELSIKCLTATRKRKRASSSNAAKRCGNKRSALVHNRIVDLMVSSLVLVTRTPIKIFIPPNNEKKAPAHLPADS